MTEPTAAAVCPACDGSGESMVALGQGSSDWHYAGCERCNGSGQKRVQIALPLDQWNLLRSVLWSAAMAYQTVAGGVGGVLHMGDLPPDFRDLMRAVSSAT